MGRRAAADNMVKLTRTSVAGLRLEPGQSERVVWDSELPGFGVRLRASGKATWVIRPPRSGGRSALFTLGGTDVIGLVEARAAAREHLAKAALGTNPHAAKRQARSEARVTVGSVIEQFLPKAQAKLKPRSFDEVRRHLTTHAKPLHTLPMAAVKRADIHERIEQIAADVGPVAANRVRASLSSLFSWAIGAGVVDANPVVGTHKAVDEAARSRVLTDTELLAVWRACREDDFGRIVKLLVLTGQRRDEVAEMCWGELDLDGAMWIIPAERTKNGRQQDVPLSAAAVQILESTSRTKGRPFVFGRGDGGAFSGYSKAKKALDARAGLATPWRLHDLRRTVSTGMNTIGVLPHVVEAVLNHVSGSRAGVAGVYNHATYNREKRDALDRWSAHVLALGKPRLQVVLPDAKAVR